MIAVEGTKLEMVTATNNNKPCQDLKIVDLNKYNVYPSYRVGQKEAIESILSTYEKIRSGEINSKIVELPSPTGSGKTIINRAAGKALLELYPDEIKKVVYTTPLKALVYQIEEDEQLGIPVVLGKSNYDCLLLEGLDASDCPFRSASLASRKPKICNRCPYTRAKYAFRDADLAACTLDFFIYNRAATDVLIIDESASLEDKLLNHFGIALPENIDLENLTDSIHEWMISLEEESENYTEMLESMNLSSTSNTNLLNDIRYLTTKLTKIERQVAKCGRILQVISSNDKAYFIDKDRNLKLVRGEYPFNSMASRVKLVIMSSGTPTTSLIYS